jgi:cytochrome c oxidase subunit I+III
MGWGSLNLLSTAGALILFISFVLLLVNAFRSAAYGEVASANPWDAGTLEWATDSPPAAYNFSRMPFVTHREPLWDNRESLPVVTGLDVNARQVITGTVTESLPQLRESSPVPTIWPLLAAIAVGGTFLGSIFTPWAVVWGSIPVTITLIGWFWPEDIPEDER